MNALPHFPKKCLQLHHTNICKKTEKSSFQTVRTFVFELKTASKHFSKKLPTTKFWIKQIWTLCLSFPEYGFNFVSQKHAKKLKKCSFQTLRTFVFELKVALGSVVSPNFDLSCFDGFASLSQKMVSTSSFKN